MATGPFPALTHCKVKRSFSESPLPGLSRGECSCCQRVKFFRKPLHLLLAQLVGQIFGLPDRQRNDGQSGILSATAGELTAVGDEQIRDVVSLAVFVAHAVPRLFALTAGTHVVSIGE